MQTIKYENQQFKQEVDLQNNMLDEVNDQMEENLDNMIKLDTKLKGLLAKGSVCKLWMCLLIEIVLLVLIIVFLM